MSQVSPVGSESQKPGALSLAVTPQQIRPIEPGDRGGGGGAVARERGGNGATRGAAQNDNTVDDKPKRPVRVPEDPAEERRGRNLNMVFDKKSGRTIIEIINPRTGEVMDRIPPENLLERARKQGLPPRANLVDETA
ncbi:MAG: flagellar protein FlaG [Alphaproteobacteria bacterium]